MSQEIKPIEPMILLIHGQKVIIDADLARLYGVSTKALNQAVKRNEKRFPNDFVFKLSKSEKVELVTNCDQFKMLKHSKSLPSAFTEHGAIMAASVLNTETAIAMSLFVVRAFVKIREILFLNKEIYKKINELERCVDSNDTQIQTLFQAIQRLIEPQKKPIKRIGFGVEDRVNERNRFATGYKIALNIAKVVANCDQFMHQNAVRDLEVITNCDHLQYTYF